MSELSAGKTKSALEVRLEILAVLFALLSIPAIFLQSVESADLRTIGQIMNIVVWVFFVAEVTILLRIAPDNVVWLRSHKFEVLVVVLASPLLTIMGEGESAFSLAPLVVLSRSLRFLRFAKIAKLLKLGKVRKIVGKSSSTPAWLVGIATVACSLLALGLFGMLIHHEAHSLADGLRYWTISLQSGVHVHWLTVAATASVFAFAIYLVRHKPNKLVDRGAEVDFQE